MLADVRWYLDGRSGRAALEAGHLPGAVFVDLDAYLAAPAQPRGGPAPAARPRGLRRAAWRSAGIGDDDDRGRLRRRGRRRRRAARVAAARARRGRGAARRRARGLRRAARDGPGEPARRPTSPRGRGRPTASPASTSCTTAAGSCSTRATATASPASSSRSTRGPATSPAPATCRRARRSTRGRLLPPDVLRAQFAEAGVDADSDGRRLLRLGRQRLPHAARPRGARATAGPAVPRLLLAVEQQRPARRDGLGRQPREHGAQLQRHDPRGFDLGSREGLLADA